MAVRRLLLIRHGQYDEREEGTKDLTAIGRAQAKHIGKALVHHEIDAVYASTMIRARTTAALIVEGRKLMVQSTPILCECIPTKIGFYIPADTIAEGKKQADRAFERFFKKTRITRTELIVCHGNIIRYLVARALDVPGVAWRKMAIYHASITEIRIHSDGRAILFAYNDVGHLPQKLVTMSGAAPKKLRKLTRASIEKVKPNS
jgi:serine/threonine-protein phosphatase PGAM5